MLSDLWNSISSKAILENDKISFRNKFSIKWNWISYRLSFDKKSGSNFAHLS